MDFITGFPRASRQHDSIMFMMDRLTKVEKFIPMKSTYSASDVTHVFIRYVVKFDGIPNKIVSNSDVKFTSKFCKELFAGLEIKLAFSTTYHSQRYGQIEGQQDIGGYVEDVFDASTMKVGRVSSTD